MSDFPPNPFHLGNFWAWVDSKNTCTWCVAFVKPTDCWVDEDGNEHKDIHQVCGEQFGRRANPWG